MKRNLLICLLFITSSYIFANKTLLSELDNIIKNKSIYFQQKEDEISKLRSSLSFANSAEEKYAICGKLFNAYLAYNTDSCLAYAEKKRQLSEVLTPFERDDSKMNLIEVMSFTGMYKEAIDHLNQLNSNTINPILQPYYYHLYRTTYGYMADYAITPDDKRVYKEKTKLYRDSILCVTDKDGLTYTLVLSDKYCAEGDYDLGLEVLENYMSTNEALGHDLALFAYNRANIYHKIGNTKQEKEQLIISSIKDLESAVREYLSLRQLAVLLYMEGDIKRAYEYMKCSLEDAKACNARMRTIETSNVYLIIEEAYQQQLAQHKKMLVMLLVCISLLVICLVMAIAYVYSQMRRLATARKQLSYANEELNKANMELKALNHNLSDSNYIKEEYIGLYMDLCSDYLEKLDNYRRSLHKIVLAGNMNELTKNIKSTKILDAELKEFYNTFDNTFLHLFPDFVSQFNGLLIEGDRIVLKPGEKLNTELRVYALVRLGITDSVKIAHFLRYSVTTIYNYRTRNRNRALGERDDFENKVMRIGHYN